MTRKAATGCWATRRLSAEWGAGCWVVGVDMNHFLPGWASLSPHRNRCSLHHTSRARTSVTLMGQMAYSWELLGTSLANFREHQKDELRRNPHKRSSEKPCLTGTSVDKAAARTED